MMTLEDAKRWYDTSKRQLKLFGRIGEKYWTELPWEGRLGRDEKLKELESGVMAQEHQFCLAHLDDFAILILFAASESAVREQVLSAIENEQKELSRLLVVQLLEEARQESKRGRIGRLLGLFKNQDAGLVEEVNQVRRYRNWAAHGRRTRRPDAVSPALAYDRMRRFLDRFAASVPDVQ